MVLCTDYVDYILAPPFNYTLLQSCCRGIFINLYPSLNVAINNILFSPLQVLMELEITEWPSRRTLPWLDIGSCPVRPPVTPATSTGHQRCEESCSESYTIIDQYLYGFTIMLLRIINRKRCHTLGQDRQRSERLDGVWSS